MAPTQSSLRKRPAAAKASTETGKRFKAEGKLPAGIKEVQLRSVKAFQPRGAKDDSDKGLPLSSRSFEENGTDILADWIFETISKLQGPDDNHFDALIARIERFAAEKKPRTLGTLCSGTDSPVLVYRAFREALRKLHVDFDFQPEFACDRDPNARRFMKSMYGRSIKKLFMMCSDVASSTRKAPDDMKDDCGDSEVPSVMDLIAGFPCQDVSALLKSVMNNRSVVRDGTKRTGGVFADIVEYIQEHLEAIESVMLENVLGIMSKSVQEEFSNLDWCVGMLEALGFWTFCFKLDPRQFGMPVARGRIWIIAVKLQTLQRAGMTSSTTDELAKKVMQQVVDDQKWRRLEDFLLPENHPELLHWHRCTSARAEKKRTGKGSKGKGTLPAWPEKHARFVEKAKGKGRGKVSGPWWQPVQPCDGIMETFPGLRRLTDRHLSTLAAHGIDVRSEEALARRSNRTMELSQEVDRTQLSPPGQAGIVLPAGELFLESRVRLAHGHEGMLLQGLHFGESHDMLGTFSSGELMTLAGNAFNSWCMAAAFVVKEVVLGVAEDRHRRQTAGAVRAWRRGRSNTLSSILTWDKTFSFEKPQ